MYLLIYPHFCSALRRTCHLNSLPRYLCLFSSYTFPRSSNSPQPCSITTFHYPPHQILPSGLPSLHTRLLHLTPGSFLHPTPGFFLHLIPGSFLHLNQASFSSHQASSSSHQASSSSHQASSSSHQASSSSHQASSSSHQASSSISHQVPASHNRHPPPRFRLFVQVFPPLLYGCCPCLHFHPHIHL